MFTRRNFLKTGALAFAATAVSNPVKLFAQTGKAKGASKKMEFSFQPFEAKYHYTFTISNFSRNSTPGILTKISYDGYTGYGEASMPPYLGEGQASATAFLQRVDLSRFNSPFEIEDIMTYLEGISTNNTAAKASVDIALHDLVGKIMGQPWWRIWGFNPNTTPNTCMTIGLDSEEVVRKKTLEAAHFNVLKVKLGMDEAKDKMMINTIRSVSNTPIFVDANQGWKEKNYALEMIHWLKERGVVMIEQPMPKLWLDEAAWVTERSPLPVIADESCQRLSDVPKLKGAFDGINIKLMKCTGLREAREMISLAQSFRMRLMVGCMSETSCGISAAAQITPKMEWADLDGNMLISNDVFNGMKFPDGIITLSEKPGIGAEPIKEYR